ncbi:hypothetical protein [Streptomyces iakyrus]|uniref:hypothetical protein n=1 Tax=Streptomyces iakyrus TaxID=68219 RepID=UPI003D948E75
MRYRARYVGPDGTEKSKSFPDKQRRLADAWLINIEAEGSAALREHMTAFPPST